MQTATDDMSASRFERHKPPLEGLLKSCSCERSADFLETVATRARIVIALGRFLRLLPYASSIGSKSGAVQIENAKFR